MAIRLALPARVGHFDELRIAHSERRDELAPHWQRFFELLGAAGFADLDRRDDIVARQIRDNGITYNVYADTDGPARPWSLDLLPMIIGPAEWAVIEKGIKQRARALNAVMADVYGPCHLLAEGLLPPALSVGHPGYLRPLAGLPPAGGTYLHIVAFDLARAPDGGWWVVSQRTQAPSGLGYVLENRLAISRMFPDAFRELHVQHLASCYRALLDTLYRQCVPILAAAGQAGATPRIVLLTPGPYNETYFEHAYLARYLGITLVEGSDLTVRDDQLFVKSMYGLERVHAVLRRLDDDFCDPLELRSESTLGVPGLLQAMRAGNVLVANALGSGFLESPGINGFLPAITERLLDESLLLPSLSSWWCGEEVARKQILPYLGDLVVKPTYPPSLSHPAFEPLIGADATPEELEAWRESIMADPDAFTVQAYLPLSQVPTWQGGRIVPRAAMLRVFAIADGDNSWRVLPGGLTRIASRDQQVVSMQRGGGSQDTWVMTSGVVDVFSLLPEHLRPEELSVKRRPVSSRAAENLFWMGRYAERADNAVRVARLALAWLNGDADTPKEFLDTLGELCQFIGLVPRGVPSPALAQRVFERVLIAALANQSGIAAGKFAGSVAYNLAALARSAGQIRDRLSPEHWRLIVTCGEEFATGFKGMIERGEYSSAEALQALDRLTVKMTAITGAQTDRMTRDDGWRLLTIGRQIERLSTMSAAIDQAFSSQIVHQESGFNLLLDVFDSAITYRAHYQRRFEIAALLDLLVLDPANPRSLACCIETLRAELARLPAVMPTVLPAVMPTASMSMAMPGMSQSMTTPSARTASGAVEDLAALLPDPSTIMLATLCERDAAGCHRALENLLERLARAATVLSDEIGQRYFSHAADLDRAVSS